MRPSGVIIGIGNGSRGDDAAGIEVARRLALSPPNGWDVMVSDCEPGGLMEAWRGYERTIIVDSVSTAGATPGTVSRWDVSRRSLPVESTTISSHALSLGEAIELARILGRLPPRIEVIGIEGESFELAAAMSPRVEAAVERVSKELNA